jgi:uncharacterized membrane-anchored protein
MKLAKNSLSGTSIVLLVIQLALVSSIAAKYLYQRSTCPRVWTRTAAYDPDMVMRGRYLSLHATQRAARHLPAQRRRNHTQGRLSRQLAGSRSLPRQAQGGRQQAAGDPHSGG